MLFSVILPTYNRKLQLLECLNELARQTLAPSEFEVIVVVDGSSDGTDAAIDGASFPYRLTVVNQANSGPSIARNNGASKAQADFLAFTEDDVTPDRDWLERAARHVRKDPTIDVLEGRTVSAGDRKDVRRFDRSGIPSFIPCNLFIRRSVFVATTGYDPAFYDRASHLYFREDADLGFRLLDSGARNLIADDAIVTHPVQFARVSDAMRHARRYLFDPLLYRKHPLRYRSMIERKTILGLQLRRVQHSIALVYLVALAGLLISSLDSDPAAITGELVTMALCALFFKFKYQGEGGFRWQRLADLPAFGLLPLLYLRALVKGCIRFRSYGPLLP